MPQKTEKNKSTKASEKITSDKTIKKVKKPESKNLKTEKVDQTTYVEKLTKPASAKSTKPFWKSTAFIVGVSVFAVFSLLVVGTLGIIGFKVYREQRKEQQMVESINSIHNDFNKIESDYEDLLKQVDGYDSSQFTQQQADEIDSKLTQTNQSLDTFDSSLSNHTQPELDSYKSALTAYTSSMKELNKGLQGLVDFSSCYGQFNAMATDIGSRFATVDEADMPKIISLYEELESASKKFSDCMNSLPSSKEQNAAIITSLNSFEESIRIVIDGIKNESLTQDQLNSFLTRAQDLQQQGRQEASNYTEDLEKQINDIDSKVDQIKKEEKEISQKYNIVFE